MVESGVVMGPAAGVWGKGAGVIWPFALGNGVGAVAAGVGVCGTAGVAGVAGAAGVGGGLGGSSGFGLSLVTRKLNFAPVPLGSHSMKLYEGK